MSIDEIKYMFQNHRNNIVSPLGIQSVRIALFQNKRLYYVWNPKVLDEIISVLISEELISDISKPQPPYKHDHVKNIIEDVAQSSAMRLDPTSSNKLWDLITMVLKWQVTFSSDLIKLTLRHLYEIETFVTQPETQLQIHKVETLMDNFRKLLTPSEQNQLREDVLVWLKNFHVRVSLLLKLGFQDNEGNFVANNNSPIAQDMLRNLGENIYAVTQNGKVLERDQNDFVNPNGESCELQMFVEQILGDKNANTNSGNETTNVLRLAISNKEVNANHRQVNFESIDVDTQDATKLVDILKDMNVNDDIPEANLQDDLLEMIGQ